MKLNKKLTKNKQIEKKEEKNENKKQKINREIIFTILAVVLISVFCVAITPVTFQNDTYYTIKIGEHINQYGIDGQDPFSWHENLGYTYPHWLYDLLTYYIYSAFGFAGIYITTCILTAILGITLYFINCKLAKNKVLSLIITVGSIYLIRGYIAARAQLVTFILFILTIFFIERFLETKKKRYLPPLLIIPLLIANLHAAVFPFYFVLYLPYIAEYLVAISADNIIYRKLETFIIKTKIKIYEKQGKLEKKAKLEAKLLEIKVKVDKIKIKREEDLKNPYKIKLVRNDAVKWLIIVFVIAGLTGLLTPIGATPYTYLVKTLEGNTTENINEHLPMTITEETEMLCVIVAILSILIFTKSKIRLCDLFMLSGLCYLALASRRQMTMFVLIGSIIFNRQLMQLVNIYFKEDGIKKVKKMSSNIVVMIILTVVILLWGYDQAKDKFNDKFVSKSTYPIEASNWILENVDLGKAKFYNEYNYGSYLIFRGIPVFIDSRADLYAPEFSGREDDIFMDFINVSSIGDFYEDTFNKYGITHVICYENSKMNMIIEKTHDPNYKQLYKDKYFVVYERLKINTEEGANTENTITETNQ